MEYNARALAFVTFLFVSLIPNHAGAQATQGENQTLYARESRLKQLLLTNYDKTVPPRSTLQSNVSVKFAIALNSIEELDEGSGILTTHVWLRKTWTDERFTWNPAVHDGVDKVAIPYTQVWIPDIVPYNSASDQFLFSAAYHVIVMNNGDVLFIPHVRLHTTCQVDLTTFPFDIQHCTMKFGSWVYNGNEISLSAWSDGLDMSSYSMNSKWEVMDASGKFNNMYYACCAEPYMDYTVTLKLKRRSHLITNIFIAPALCFGLLTPLVFLLPSDSGSKLVLGSGLVISQTVIVQMLVNMMPTNHHTLPTLASYLLTNVVLVSLSLAFSTVIINLAERAKKAGSGVPALVDRVFLGPVSRLVCVRREDYIEDQDAGGGSSNMAAEKGPTFDDSATMVAQYTRLVAPAEWRQLAVVLDRLLLACFLIAAVIVTIMLLALSSQ